MHTTFIGCLFFGDAFNDVFINNKAKLSTAYNLIRFCDSTT